jgi:hypothetical protein
MRKPTVILWNDPRATGRRYDSETHEYVRKTPESRRVQYSKPTTGRELYRALEAYLGDKHDRPAPRNGRSVTIRWAGDHTVRIQLHWTDILTVYSDGRIMLYWGGWHTVTTNTCMNEYLPTIYGVSGLSPAYIRTPKGEGAVHSDTVWIGARGSVPHVKLYPDWQAARNAERRRERAEAKKYEALQIRLKKRAEREHRAWLKALPTATKDDPLPLVKFLQERDGVIVSNYDGSPWTVGVWRDETLRGPCEGLNASVTIAHAAHYVVGSVLAEVEGAGRYYRGKDKVTCDSMRIVRAWRVEAYPYVMPTRTPDWEAKR